MPGKDFVSIYNSEKMEIEYYSFTGTAFPGISMPPVNVPGPTFFIMLHSNYSIKAALDSYYGFKMYAYPVIQRPSSPTTFTSNIAASIGGAIFSYKDLIFPILSNIAFTLNSAGTGGALALLASSTGM
jgi:predicted outer membrane repeat protein